MESKLSPEIDSKMSDRHSTSSHPLVIVVDGYSTGRFYTSELKKRGYRSYHLASGAERASEALSAYVAHAGDDLLHDYEGLLEHNCDIEETARKVAELQPVAILAGCECAVELTDALAEKLGLAGNCPASSQVRRNKDLMQQALSAGGLRSIRSLKTNSLSELLAFAKSLDSQVVVVKPLRSSGTDGVHFCHTPEELQSAFENLMGSRSFFGEVNDAILAQEFIHGPEIVINTVSSGGRHCVSDVWLYNKVINEDAPVYEHVRLAVELDAELRKAASYCMSVLDLLGIKQGPAHAEIILAKDGPALVECAARPMGGGFPQDLMRESLGHTQIEWALDSYLDLKRFESYLKMPYKAVKHYLVKFFVSTRQGELTSIPSATLLSGLKSMRSGNFVSLFENYRVERTVDLFTSPAYLCLCHEDGDIVMNDAALVRELEVEGQNELFELAPDGSSVEMTGDWFAHIPDALWLKSEEEARQDALLVARALNIAAGMELLDAPCGDCRVGIHLAALGVKYTGLDLNPRFVQKARERFSQAGIQADLSVDDMRNIDYEGRFDLVLNWFNSFGYFGVEEDFEMLKRLSRSLKPGGRLLMESPNRANILQNIRGKHDNKGNALSPVWDGVTERVLMEVPMPDGQGMKSVVIGTRMYSLNQLKLLFRLAGLQVLKVFDEGLNEFGEKSQRVILLAEK